MDEKQIAQAVYEKAQEAQRIARKNLDDQNAALADWKAKFEEAKKVLDASKPALQILKAQLQKADADVTIARAELAKLAPEAVASGKGASQSDLCAAVVRVLAASPSPLTNEALFARLQAEGVEMAGDKARQNLTAYIARWAKVPGADIVSAGRGLWTVKSNQPPVPAFLAPAEEPKPEVPAFLAPGPAAEPAVTEEPADEVEGPEGYSMLPEGFPGRDALTEAGYVSRESLEGKTHDQIRRIKGVGAQTARDILAALEG